MAGRVEPPTPAHWAYYASLVRETGATVGSRCIRGTDRPRRRCDTEHGGLFPAQIREHGAENVSVLGDSAGAAITLAATQELVRRGQPVPASLVLVSPWLDATMTDTAPAPYFDPFLNVDTLRTTGKMWAGNLSTRDPRVSPLFGSLAGLPPTYVYSGSVDLLSETLSRCRGRPPRPRCPYLVRYAVGWHSQLGDQSDAGRGHDHGTDDQPTAPRMIGCVEALRTQTDPRHAR